MSKAISSAIIVAFLVLPIPAFSNAIVEGQRTSYEEDDWTFTVNEDRTVSAELIVTIHPREEEIRERTINLNWLATGFQVRDYGTGLPLTIAVIENKTVGQTRVNILFREPQRDGYKFVVTFLLRGNVERLASEETKEDTYRFYWSYGREMTTTQRVTVRLPPNYKLVSLTPAAWEKSVEDERQIVRFSSASKLTSQFGWSVTYVTTQPARPTASPPTAMEQLIGQIRASRDILYILGIAAGGLASVGGGLLGFFFKTRKQRLGKNYLKKIVSTFDNLSADRKRCRKEMASLRHEIDLLFDDGKIDEVRYDMLVKKIEFYLQKLFEAKRRRTRLAEARK